VRSADPRRFGRGLQEESWTTGRGDAAEPEDADGSAEVQAIHRMSFRDTQGKPPDPTGISLDDDFFATIGKAKRPGHHSGASARRRIGGKVRSCGAASPWQRTWAQQDTLSDALYRID
jgi:hypothetical protein